MFNGSINDYLSHILVDNKPVFAQYSPKNSPHHHKNGQFVVLVSYGINKN